MILKLTVADLEAVREFVRNAPRRPDLYVHHPRCQFMGPWHHACPIPSVTPSVTERADESPGGGS